MTNTVLKTLSGFNAGRCIHILSSHVEDAVLASAVGDHFPGWEEFVHTSGNAGYSSSDVLIVGIAVP